MLCILLPSYNREVWGLLPIFIRMRHRWPQVGEYDAGSLPESTTIASIWLGMSCICIYIYVFTIYDYTSISCIFKYQEAKSQPGRLFEFQFHVVSLLPFYSNYLWSTFRFTYQYIFIRTDVPLSGDTAFCFVRAGLDRDSDRPTR